MSIKVFCFIGALSYPLNKASSHSDVRSLEAHLVHVHPNVC